MPTIHNAIMAATQVLGERLEAEWLLCHVLHTSRVWLIAHGEEMLQQDADGAFSGLVDRRVAGEPIAYLTGRRGFWSLDMEVTPATLIPRPETERLVELALQRLPPAQAQQVLDLGTGSGAIALALASERSHAQVMASDESHDALAVARRNAQRHHLTNVAFVQGDWFAPLARQRFHLIVSNPPYIASDDPHLQQGDLRYEPRHALASGTDGLDDIRNIVRMAPAHLMHDGWLLFEHGWNQGEAVRALLRAAGFMDVFTAQDLEQRDRVSGGRWLSSH